MFENRQECCGEESSAYSQCCPSQTTEIILPDDEFLLNSIVSLPKFQQISTKLTRQDRIGSWKARWGINRMNFKINPGLYRVGDADKMSPVLVTANYKMSFDVLRKELAGLNAWILVLDTKGINVWCAAGKGTFGTDELVRRLKIDNLARIVSHKNIILPQLSASGVSAHEVQRRSGFKVTFGPVRARDIKEFLQAGMRATSEMRKVRFNLIDRLVLTPMELVGTYKTALMVFGVLFILNLLKAGSFGAVDFYGYIGALLTGCFIVPVLLPWIPGKAFAWKGWLMGMVWAAAVNIINGWPLYPEYGLFRVISYMLILPAVSAFYAMNFTGASTYTSFSGVLKEMKTAVPAIIASTALGTVLLLLSVIIPKV